MKTILRFFAATAFALVLQTRSFAADTASQTDVLQVEIRMFSGRPNPVFVISDQKLIQDILDSATSMPKNASFKKATVLPSILGYQGMVLENISKVRPDVAGVRLFHSDIEIEHVIDAKAHTTATDFSLDANRSLEQRVLAYAESSKALPAELLAHLKQLMK